MKCIIFVAASALLAAPASAATFVRNHDTLAINGSIGEADAVVFEVQLNDSVRTVVLNSSGGRVFEAMEIGKSIRKHDLNTAVPANAACESACVLIWSAGRHRTCSNYWDSPRKTAYYPNGLNLAMEPADLWAIANLKIKELPPVEYDHPYQGQLWIVEVKSEAELREICHYTKTGFIIIGCATVRPGQCIIHLAPIPPWSGIYTKYQHTPRNRPL